MKREVRTEHAQSILNRYEMQAIKIYQPSSNKRQLLPKHFRVVRRKPARSQQRAHSKGELRQPANKQRVFSLAKGNNHQLVSSVFEAEDWTPIERGQIPSLIWVQDSRGLDFGELSKSKTLINAFECHEQLTNKEYLYANLRFYCNSKKQSFVLMPTSFSVNFSKPAVLVQAALSEFLQYYISQHPKGDKLKLRGSFSIIREGKEISIRYKDLSTVQRSNQPNEIAAERYVWILKPSDRNRGTGIKLFSKLKCLQQLLSNDVFNLGMYASEPQQTSFVIQKYIENPLLIDGRKFDIRVWALIDCKGCLYFFREGYLRLSSQKFSLKDIVDPYVHLTNNAIQKNSEKYGKLEEGNQWSFERFSEYLKASGSTLDFELKKQQMRRAVKICYESTSVIVNPKHRKNCFQLFGYDFLIAADGRLWLLEVNCNPCLEESSAILRTLVPKLLTETLHIVNGTFQEGYFQLL